MKRMLVVEDDLFSREVLHRIFYKEFEIDSIESYDEFYEKYKEVKYDIVIMDIALKGKRNGLDLIMDMKLMPHYNSTPILCMSAHAFSRDKKAAMDAGADKFLAKPVENKVLVETINMMLNQN